MCQAWGLVPLQLMLSFLQNEGVQGLLSLLDNSIDIRLCNITDEPGKAYINTANQQNKFANCGKKWIKCWGGVGKPLTDWFLGR